MYDSGVNPLKGGGTKWIGHKSRTIGGLLEKFGLYVGQLKDSTSSSKNSAAPATEQGKLKKLVDVKVLLCYAFFTTFWQKLRNKLANIRQKCQHCKVVVYYGWKLDMWHHCFMWKRGYNFLNGTVTVISVDTWKCIDYRIRTKNC